LAPGLVPDVLVTEGAVVLVRVVLVRVAVVRVAEVSLAVVRLAAVLGWDPTGWVRPVVEAAGPEELAVPRPLPDVLAVPAAREPMREPEPDPAEPGRRVTAATAGVREPALPEEVLPAAGTELGVAVIGPVVAGPAVSAGLLWPAPTAAPIGGAACRSDVDNWATDSPPRSATIPAATPLTASTLATTVMIGR
jgi:hypothetical protein